MAACQPDETVTAYGGEGTWRLTHLDSKSANLNLTLNLQSNGDVMVSGSCATLKARQTEPYPWFALDNTRETHTECEISATEQDAISAIQSATLVEVSNDTLLLTDADALGLTFVRISD